MSAGFCSFIDRKQTSKTAPCLQHLCGENKPTNRFSGRCSLSLRTSSDAHAASVPSGGSLCTHQNIPSDGKPQNWPVPAWNRSDENPQEWGEIPPNRHTAKKLSFFFFFFTPKILLLCKTERERLWSGISDVLRSLSVVMHCQGKKEIH